MQAAKFAVEKFDCNDDFIKSRIFTIRGVQVMLDRDLAILYGVPAKRLNEQVKRNVDRFPDSFMFRLSDSETQQAIVACDSIDCRSRSQIATINKGRGSNIKYQPVAFTEHGIIMLASVLKSAVAVEASIRIINTFVAMRKALASIAPMLARLDAVERRQIYDQSRNEEKQQRNEERFDTIFKTTGVFHDRFLILDDKELYHFGASLKNLGRRYCAVSRMDAMFIPSIMERI